MVVLAVLRKIANVLVLFSVLSLQVWALNYNVTLNPSEDSTIRESGPNQNRGSATPIYVQQSYGPVEFTYSVQGFTPVTGTWSMASGYYQVSSGPGNRISLSRVSCNNCAIRVTGRTGSGSTYPNNGFVVFDYVNSSNYKVAGFSAQINAWVIGDVISGTYTQRASSSATFQASTDYIFDVQLISATKTAAIKLIGNPSPTVSYVFSSINESQIGLGTLDSKQGWFDNFYIALSGTEGDSTGSADRAVIKFSQSAISSAVGSGQFVSAKLRLYLEKSQWADSGHSILTHRLTTNWTELGVTWNCPIDTNVSNTVADCGTQWGGGTFNSQSTGSVLHQHNQTGWVEFDVTADVSLFLSGTSNFGWLLKKNTPPDTAMGVIGYTSREGTSQNSPQLLLTVNDNTPPTITAAANPAANGAGWNNTDVTVTFTCSDSASGIQSCSSPVTVSTEGANQLVTGTAQDNAGNSANTSLIINLDSTEPALQILSPQDRAVVHQNSVQLSGTLTDSLSGISSITCDGVPANYSAGSFSCSRSLAVGLNSITVTAMDIAGNQTVNILEITYTAQSNNTYTFFPTADVAISDAYDYGTGINYGLHTSMRIESAGAAGGVLAQFSPAQMISTIGWQHISSARLEFYVENNFNDWGNGAYLDARRMLSSWDEAGVTYDCWPSDNDLSNPAPDCDETWSGGNYEDYSSDSVIQQNGTGVWKSFDVTSDVQLLQNGHDTYGWIIRKRNLSDSGSVDFTSIQGNTAQKPRLVVVADDQSCLPASIGNVSPALIPSDGSINTITVSGQNLDQISNVFVDKVPISFTLVNSSTITFTLTSSVASKYSVSFRANCLSEPLSLYSIESDTSQFQVYWGCPEFR